MIAEDYVGFATAKLLIEKGFDIDECEVHYDTEDHARYEITLQMAMKWLREVHHLFIGVEPRLSLTDYYWITAKVYRVRKKNSLYHAKPVNDYSCAACCDGNSFEDACGAAIKYCLENLI